MPDCPAPMTITSYSFDAITTSSSLNEARSGSFKDCKIVEQNKNATNASNESQGMGIKRHCGSLKSSLQHQELAYLVEPATRSGISVQSLGSDEAEMGLVSLSMCRRACRWWQAGRGGLQECALRYI
jgi:hypothetical protein